MEKTTKGKIISLKGWKEARNLEETIEAGLFYQSLMRGADKEGTNKAVSYFKIVYSVTSQESSEDDLFFEFEEDEFLAAIRDETTRGLIPLNGHVIEKYEFYDLNTDDIHVIYRIPYQPLGLG